MIAQFAIRLLCGIGLMWSLMPRREVTTGFFRIQMLVALGLSVLAALMTGHLAWATDARAPVLSPQASRLLCLAVAAAAFIGSVVWTLGRRRGGDICVFVIAALSTALLLLSTPLPEQVVSLRGVLAPISVLSSAALLGSAVTGMLLGHWYLTAPTMSIAPLSRLTLYFAVAAGVRLLVAALGLAPAWAEITGGTAWIGMVLVLRWAAGIVGPLVAAGMVWRILKYRNTQSATGVLFAGVILCFLGEMSAALLYREIAVPL